MADIAPRRNQGRGNLMSREPFHRLQDVFDNFFSPLMQQSTFPEWTGMRFWDFDMDTTENEVIVRAEMPGFEPDDIEVSVEENVLTIRAEKRAEGEQERDYRSFHRTATLPMGIDPDRVAACYRNGVLELRIPRKEEAKPRRIRVQGHAGGEGKHVETGEKKEKEKKEK